MKNRSSPTAPATHLQHQHQQYPETGNSRNGGSINRGIEFLRNAFFGNGGTGSTVGTPSNSIGRNGSGSNGNDSKDYRRLHSHSYQPNAELQTDSMFDFLLTKKDEPPTDNHVTMPPQPWTSIKYDISPPPLRNGFVVQSLPPKDSLIGMPSPAHQYNLSTPSASHHQSTTNNASPTQISNTPADHQRPAGPQTQEFELKSC